MAWSVSRGLNSIRLCNQVEQAWLPTMCAYRVMRPWQTQFKIVLTTSTLTWPCRTWCVDIPCTLPLLCTLHTHRERDRQVSAAIFTLYVSYTKYILIPVAKIRDVWVIIICYCICFRMIVHYKAVLIFIATTTSTVRLVRIKYLMWFMTNT